MDLIRHKDTYFFIDLTAVESCFMKFGSGSNTFQHSFSSILNIWELLSTVKLSYVLK